MKPSIIDRLNFVNASYHSMHGLIKSHWEKDNGNFSWDITVPGNTTAEVYIPASSSDEVLEDNIKAALSPGIKFLKMENGNAVFEMGSGEYHFKVSKQ
jgi:alpha-L-rhamnosidase